jgi:hypothetical protein
MSTKTAQSVITLAVAAAMAKIKPTDSDGTLAPGVYHVDETIRVRGTVKKGEDYEQNITAKAQPWALLALALSKLNKATGRSIVEEATELVRESEQSGLSIKEALSYTDQITGAANEAIAKIKKSTKQTCSGKTNVSCTYEVVTAEE